MNAEVPGAKSEISGHFCRFITSRRSGGVLQIPQQVRVEPGHQMHFGTIHSPKFANLLKSQCVDLTKANIRTFLPND